MFELQRAIRRMAHDESYVETFRAKPCESNRIESTYETSHKTTRGLENRIRHFSFCNQVQYGKRYEKGDNESGTVNGRISAPNRAHAFHVVILMSHPRWASRTFEHDSTSHLRWTSRTIEHERSPRFEHNPRRLATYPIGGTTP